MAGKEGERERATAGAEGRGRIRGGETCGTEEDEVRGMGVNGRDKEFLLCASRIYTIGRGRVPGNAMRGGS
jgi:hypothetical protein